MDIPNKKYKPKREEVEDFAYPEEEVAVAMPADPEPEKVEDVEDKCDERSEILHSFVVKELDEFVKLQVMTSTVKGQKYLVVPLMYFTMTPEEIILLDDSALIPFETSQLKN